MWYPTIAAFYVKVLAFYFIVGFYRRLPLEKPTIKNIPHGIDIRDAAVNAFSNISEIEHLDERALRESETQLYYNIL